MPPTAVASSTVPVPPERAGGGRGPAWGFAAIFLLTLLAYGPALGGGFIWDDDRHVTKMALQSLAGLRRIWFEVGATQQYYPVLHTAFWVEHRLWGEAALGYHLLNVFLHATSACLFVLVLRRFWADRLAPWLGGLLFALHPVGVESVAWISEQKNTLSTVFYLLAVLAYLRFDDAGREGARRPAATYALATGLFLLALLSKSVTATLPAALLVLIWWRRGRLGLKRDGAPLLPWLGLGVGMGLFTAWVERTYIGAEGAPFNLSFLERGLLAGRVIWFYLGKLVWPSNLVFIYPRWQVSAAAAGQYLYPAGVLILLGLLGWQARRARGPLAAFLFFAGTLVPALGFVNVYPFVYSYVADHFQYLASLGILALAAGAWAEARGRGWGTPARYGAAAVLLLLGGLTWRQCHDYRDAETLYRRTLAKNPDCWMAEVNLGKILHESGRTPEAIAHYEAGARLHPQAKSYYDWGNALQDAGRMEEAQARYEAALRLEPNYADAHVNLALILAGQNQLAAAAQHDELALRLLPNLAEAHNNLGNVYFRQRRLAEAQAEFETALRLRPAYAKARNGLGGVLFRSNQFPAAAEQFAAAIRIDPTYAEAHLNLAVALVRMQRVPEAVAECEAALRLRPNLAPARNLLRQLQQWERNHGAT